MRKELIETGKTVYAAIDAACVKLGCERENCEWEIIDLPKKGFLGLKVFPAKVKVSIEVPDEKPPVQPQTQREIPPREQQRPQAARPEKREEPRQEHTERNERTFINEHTLKDERTLREERPKKDQQKPAQSQERPRHSEQRESAPRIEVNEGFTEKELLAMGYINSILAEFGITAKLLLFREGSGICINITGEGLGTIIGRRGETLDAIQYLAGLVANRLEGDYMRVTVDCGDYRNKRKETLEALARKLSAQVLKTNISKTLEPMNPFERRVIHATVSEIEGVSSSSIGDEPNRRVVITSPTSRKPYSGRSFGRDGERRSSGRGGRGCFRQAGARMGAKV